MKYFIIILNPSLSNFYFKRINIIMYIFINPLASPGARAPAFKYGYVNIETPSPIGEVKGLIYDDKKF